VSQFVGERVQVTFTGIVQEITEPAERFNSSHVTRLTVRLSSGRDVQVDYWSGVEVITLAPVYWPPQAGDVWTDKTGTSWFFCLANPHTGDDATLSARAGDGRFVNQVDVDRTVADWMLSNVAPMEMAYRKGFYDA
jgi:hypothetical protein